MFTSPGLTELTRMPCGPWSIASARVMLTTAPFEAQYEIAWPPPLRPQPEPVLTIEPPPSAAMIGTTCLHIRKIDAHVHAEDAVPLLDRGLDGGGAADDAGVVEDDVDAAELVDRRGTTRSMSASLATSAAMAIGGAAGRADLGGDGFGGLGVQVDDGDGRALRSEGERRRTADAAGAAGDDGLLVLKAHGLLLRGIWCCGQGRCWWCRAGDDTDEPAQRARPPRRRRCRRAGAARRGR